MLIEDISLINCENPGEVVSYWFVVFSRHWTKGARAKHCVHCLTLWHVWSPAYGQPPSGPATTSKWKVKLVSHKPGSSGFEEIPVLQTQKQCLSGAGYAMSEAQLWGRCGGTHQPSLPKK